MSISCWYIPIAVILGSTVFCRLNHNEEEYQPYAKPLQPVFAHSYGEHVLRTKREMRQVRQPGEVRPLVMTVAGFFIFGRTQDSSLAKNNNRSAKERVPENQALQHTCGGVRKARTRVEPCLANLTGYPE